MILPPMKRQLWIIFATILWGMVGTQLFAASFYDPFSQIHLAYDREWTRVIPSADVVLSLRHEDGITSLNVFVYAFDEPVTLKSFAQAQINLYYDGWQLLGERERSEGESARANLAASQVAIYARPYLTAQLTEGKYIAAETYYLDATRTHGVVLSIHTVESQWSTVQNSVKTVLDSFWVGDQAPTAGPAELRVTASGGRLKATDARSQNEKWAMELSGSMAGQPMLYQGIVYVVVEEPTPILYGLWADSGRPLFDVSLMGPLQGMPVAVEGGLFTIEGSTIVRRAPDSGDVVATVALPTADTPLQWDTDGKIAFVLTQSDRQEILIAVDLETGALRWQLPLEDHIVLLERDGDQLVLIPAETEGARAGILFVEIQTGKVRK